MENSKPTINDRLLKRVSTLKNAKIVYNNGHCVIDCVVRNLSQAGARIELPSGLDLPENITLVINGGPKHVCEVAWSKNDHIGVQFVDPKDIETPATNSRNNGSSSCSSIAPSAKTRAELLERITSIQHMLDELKGEIEASFE